MERLRNIDPRRPIGRKDTGEEADNNHKTNHGQKIDGIGSIYIGQHRVYLNAQKH